VDFGTGDNKKYVPLRGQISQMNKREKYLVTLGTLFPLIALASGGDVLDWMWIEFFVVIGFVTTLVFSRISWTGKGLMIVVFIVTEYLTIKLTDDLPYSKNKLMINLVSVIAPALTTIVAYWTLKSRFKRTN
jgi:hypothetical protein